MTISIGATSLPNPSREDIQAYIRGASYLLSDGQPQHDNISTTVKQRFSLSWSAILASDVDSIKTAVFALYAAVATYTDIRGDSFNVTAAVGREPVKITTLNASVLRYNVTVNFEEN